MLKEISSVFSFLTIIPSNNTNLETVAKYMHIFPIIGIVIGLIIGSIGFGLSFFLDPLIVSLLAVASIAVITGIHHTDGLADFADGLMNRGTKEKKCKAMKDLSTGSAGIVSVVLYVVGAIIALSLTSGYELLQAILLSEILAKFSMVLMASIGNSAAVGSNSYFVSGEFVLVAAKTLEKQCELFNESITWKIIGFLYSSNSFSSERSILVPLPPAITSPIIVIQKLTGTKVL